MKEPSSEMLANNCTKRIREFGGAFDSCVVITINDDVTPELAKEVLKTKAVTVETFPYSRTDFVAWKVEMCRKYKVQIMFDDDPEIIAACNQAGILGLLVTPRY